eukprot:5712277-Prymnesium_polylepis.1
MGLIRCGGGVGEVQTGMRCTTGHGRCSVYAHDTGWCALERPDVLSVVCLGMACRVCLRAMQWASRHRAVDCARPTKMTIVRRGPATRQGACDNAKPDGVLALSVRGAYGAGCGQRPARRWHQGARGPRTTLSAVHVV